MAIYSYLLPYINFSDFVTKELKVFQQFSHFMTNCCGFCVVILPLI
ncbi:hypothetical protein VAE151_560858 [Vibrio aestuarianus]|nr:hypothetical protein VAE308_1051503 [Vibrio aestuarianus]CAH8210432.1 hypothetical protein VIBAE_A32094 [Vibrio aestuarianus subsp. francensis]CAH8211450.1 hypothetical protein VAE032_271499 [Vibrio aestuarianus]CAH8212204.1 hypothetical protein VAE115_321501 [Vibrio aestuarianus]CAH8221783.1 hypothetical protein VAE016_371498 [Vibrio aestuarianus]